MVTTNDAISRRLFLIDTQNTVSNLYLSGENKFIQDVVIDITINRDIRATEESTKQYPFMRLLYHVCCSVDCFVHIDKPRRANILAIN